MTILTGVGKAKLNGQKALTKDKDIVVIEEPSTVYIPLVIGMSTAFDVHVKEGDVVAVGTKLATRTDMYVPIYSSVSGKVLGIEKRMHSTGRPQEHIVIENDKLGTRVKALEISNPDSMSKEEVFNAIKELGLVGLGGSGFPTYIKYSKTDGIHTVLINAVECEPFITSDHVVMKQEVNALFDGVNYMMIASGATKGIIAIKEHKPDLFEALTEGAKNWPNISVVEVPDRYPMGWERTLIQTVFKKDFDRLPGEIGVVVNNSTTAICLSNGIRNGEPITHRVVTFSGDVLNNPCNVKVPVGTPVGYIVDQIGGYKDVAEGILIGGGPMMGKSMMNDNVVISMYANAITCLERKNIKSIACLRCGLCTLHCPAKLQPVQIMNAQKSKDIDKLNKLDTMRCVECGLCTYTCPSKIEVTDFVAQAKRAIQLASKK